MGGAGNEKHRNEKLSEPDPDFCQGTQTAEPHDHPVHRSCGVSGHGGVQYGRHGDSDGNLKPSSDEKQEDNEDEEKSGEEKISEETDSSDEKQEEKE